MLWPFYSSFGWEADMPWYHSLAGDVVYAFPVLLLVACRYFRLKRAMNLSLKYDYLPKDQWTKPDEDVQELNPVISQVRKENDERAAWDNQNA